MHKSLATLLEIALVGGGLALATAGCSGDDDSGTTDATDAGTDAGCPTGGCPTGGCPTGGCPTSTASDTAAK